MQRPFAFWLPAFILLFLLWAWVDSCYRVSSALIRYDGNGNSGSCMISFRTSRFVIRLTHISGEQVRGEPVEVKFFREGIPPHIDTSWFPLPDATHEQRSGPIHRARGGTWELHSRFLYIPLWCILSVFLASWWATLRWFRRRASKCLATPAPHVA